MVSFLWSCLFVGSFGFSQAWELVSERDEVRVYVRRVEGSATHAFKALATIEAPIETVASLIVNLDRAKYWNPDLESARTLEVISEVERVDYWHYRTPFVIDDRDFVLHSKATVDPKDGSIHFRFRSTQHKAAPSADHVRGKLHESLFKLTPSQDGDQTQIHYEVHADPMGAVPKWLINSFSKDFPRQMMVGIRNEIRRKPVALDSRILNHYPLRTGFKAATKSSKNALGL